MDTLNKVAFLKQNKKMYYAIAWWIIVFIIIFVIFGPYFTIKNVNILKKDNLTNINIAYKAIDSIRWRSIFSVKEKDIYDKLKIYQHNIKDIDINTTLPNNLKITIESYKWLFNTVVNNKTYTITENGTLVPNKPEEWYKNLKVINNTPDEINKFLDYKDVFDEKYINDIFTLVNKIEENIIDIKVQDITYYIIEREVHIKTTNNLLLFSLDEDIIEQIEKTVVFHKQYHYLEKYGIYYSDFRIPNKVFYCPIEEEFRCIQNIKRIYNKK